MHDIAAEWLAWLGGPRHCSADTLRGYTGVMQRLCEAFADPLAVTPQQLEEWGARPREGRALGQPGKPATIAHELAVVKSFFTWARDRGHVDANPAALAGVPRVSNVNPRPIPDHDWRKLWHAELPDDLRVVLGLGFYVGLRRAEIMRLEARHVDTLSERLVGFARKGGGDDIVPYGDCCRVLERVDDGSLTFAQVLRVAADKASRARQYIVRWRSEGITDLNVVNRKMRQATVGLGLPPYTPHQLRHSFVTNMLRCGVPLHLVQRLANHSSPTVTSRYIKAGGAELREWIEGGPLG